MRTPPGGGFTVVLRGYRREQVDALFAEAEQALTLTDPDQRAALRRRLRLTVLEVGWRGYARSEVDQHLSELLIELS
jgi:cell division septum initiation protein DivIVA